MQIGEVIMWSGVAQLFLIPLVPKLMQRIDARYLAAAGFSLFALSCFMNSHLTPDTGIDELGWSQLVRACGQPLMIVPLTSITTGGIEPKQAGSASGLFNMICNLGGSIGIAILSTLLTWRERFHSNLIGESVSLFDLETQQRIEQLTQGFISRGSNPITAHAQAIAPIDNLARPEAYVMAFKDGFYFVGIALLVSGVTLLFCKKVKPGAGLAAH
jgi:DHA2 family multidrug resistance protein